MPTNLTTYDESGRETKLSLLRTFVDDSHLILSVSFDGGPILVSYQDGEHQADEIVDADPYFKRFNHHVAAATYTLHPPRFPDGRGVVHVTFSNQMLPVDPPSSAEFRIEISSPNRTRSGSTKAPLLYGARGTVDAMDTIHVGLLVIHYDPFPASDEGLGGST